VRVLFTIAQFAEFYGAEAVTPGSSLPDMGQVSGNVNENLGEELGLGCFRLIGGN